MLKQEAKTFFANQLISFLHQDRKMKTIYFPQRVGFPVCEVELIVKPY